MCLCVCVYFECRRDFRLKTGILWASHTSSLPSTLSLTLSLSWLLIDKSSIWRARTLLLLMLLLLLLLVFRLIHRTCKNHQFLFISISFAKNKKTDCFIQVLFISLLDSNKCGLFHTFLPNNWLRSTTNWTSTTLIWWWISTSSWRSILFIKLLCFDCTFRCFVAILCECKKWNKM